MSSWEILFDQDHMAPLEKNYKQNKPKQKNKKKNQSLAGKKIAIELALHVSFLCVCDGFVVIQIEMIQEKPGVEVPVQGLLITLVHTVAPASNWTIYKKSLQYWGYSGYFLIFYITKAL